MRKSCAIVSSTERRLAASLAALLSAISIFACTVTPVPGTPGNPGAQVQTSGWYARRYIYATAWASVTAVEKMSELDNTEQAVVQNGYVTTDKNGQARVRMGSNCTVYVFQNSASGYSGETITTCTKDSPSACNNNLNTLIANNPTCKISLHTIPATVTFEGTVAIVLEYSNMESVVILMPEGTASVAPTGGTVPAFQIPEGRAAYISTDGFTVNASAFFGFPPGEIRPFGDFVKSIQNEGRVPQIQRANLLLAGRNLPLVPIPEPYQLGLWWIHLDDKYVADASEAVAGYVHWGDLLDQHQFAGIPLLFQAGGQIIDLRAHAYSPEESQGMLAEAGFAPGREIVLGFDVSIPNLASLASAIRDALQAGGLLSVSLEPYDPRSNEDPFLKFETMTVPAVILGGY
jgi:hypothetical protein